MRIERLSGIILALLCVGAGWAISVTSNRVFYGVELLAASAGIGVIMALYVHSRRDKESFSSSYTDKRRFFMKLPSIAYICISLIFVAILAVGTSIGKSFEVIAFVDSKYESSRRGNVSYMIDAQHKEYGEATFNVSKYTWSGLENDSPILLQVHKNVFGLLVINDFEPLSK
ncbi:hypothetical protein [Vibrio hangzhouensis]|uniref:hypothetical protein n=1 Tax=Vibrio hangzhouensis TaxID=462991 RepID=UPI001C98E10A|nr:hypothetical protein [Vibrio hangzhouensis]MBY6199706.1 hypothetical protein [Vibrio hangzhouensis]